MLLNLPYRNGLKMVCQPSSARTSRMSVIRSVPSAGTPRVVQASGLARSGCQRGLHPPETMFIHLRYSCYHPVQLHERLRFFARRQLVWHRAAAGGGFHPPALPALHLRVTAGAGGDDRGGGGAWRRRRPERAHQRSGRGHVADIHRQVHLLVPF